MTTFVSFVCGHMFSASTLTGFVHGSRDPAIVLDELFCFSPSAFPAPRRYENPLPEFGSAFKTARLITNLTDLEHIKTREGDNKFVVCAGLPWLLPASLISRLTQEVASPSGTRAFQRALVGAHPSLLPQGRGQSPVQWTLLEGAVASGVSSFILSDGLDDGPLLAQAPIKLSRNETATTLFKKVRIGHETVGRALANSLPGNLTGIPQADAAELPRPQRRASQGYICPTSSAADIVRLVRAHQHPYSRAFILLGSHLHFVRSARIWTEDHVPPGTTRTAGSRRVFLGCRDGTLLLTLEQPHMQSDPVRVLPKDITKRKGAKDAGWC